ncbi:ribbon-helix-helix protein, CopG family [Gloeobacter kilaueensis]|uniref:Ribbon-helix-helix protein, copG family n=1 Tax=Gloeobacter kilaueensis (strain ATCC BAA-2537 / CCAP 1431/1 / ULC 316 / JS1) TaxID=1183438 RepID=U5QMM5_GLOK1|nr:ribbon-helix-helix protein, CopG family [Gloeobacter kilaueensis]AGY58905.1 ribbon-helix-helix protein, copG family [Gloeobacter kilaueensis JS1]
MAEKKKLTVNLSDDALADLEQIAKAQGITLTEAIRKALATEGYLLRETKLGRKILVQDPSTKEIRELVFR